MGVWVHPVGHELRGVMALLDCRVPGLHLPLMVLCDYHGWRCLQQLLLIDQGTECWLLLYCLWGRILFAMEVQMVGEQFTQVPSICNAICSSLDREMNAKVEAVARILNLQGEYVWDVKKEKKTYLYLSSDIEGHFGKDKRYYLVDTARLLPPATPKEGTGIREFRTYFLRCSGKFPDKFTSP